MNARDPFLWQRDGTDAAGRLGRDDLDALALFPGMVPVENTNIGLRPRNANRPVMGDSSRFAANYRLGGNVISTSPHGGRVS